MRAHVSCVMSCSARAYARHWHRPVIDFNLDIVHSATARARPARHFHYTSLLLINRRLTSEQSVIPRAKYQEVASVT